jgi:eukaryotic-like serine/threonine-protein kinase
VQTATADPLVGRVLEGRYLLTARIARGGMSTVYSAVDGRLERVVAIKVMSAALSTDPAFGDRFAREARAAARLAHVNTVSVFDQGSDAGHVFLVMEMVEGRTLRDLLREQSPLTPSVAISVMEPVLAALAAAHRAGLVHHDIKPENILISDDGVVKVADFGLARAVEAEDSATRTGLMMGTVAYCPPEQISRGRCDQRSDVYAAGVVLFELLTGRTPFAGETAMAIAYQHVHSRVPAPSTITPGVPAELDAVVRRATDRDPERRPKDAGELLSELEGARTALGLPVIAVPPRRRSGLRSAPAPHADRITGPLHTTERLAPGMVRHDTSVVGPAPYVAVAPRATRPPPGRSAQPAPPSGQRQGGQGGRGGPTNRTAEARRRRRRSTLIVTLVILLLGIAAGVGAWWFVSGRYSKVPNVTGESRTTAQSALRQAGFDRARVTTEYSETVAKDEVIRTNPPSGSQLTRNRSITLIMSSGKERFVVPDVRNTSPAAAQASLAKFPFQVSLVPQPSDTVPPDTVIGTNPPNGTQAKRGEPVQVLVSNGPPIVSVPDVTNQSQDDATKALTDAGFKVAVSQDVSETVDEGEVISQQPSGGGQAAKGSTVTITVSQGTPFVTIPSISGGTSVDDATAQLTDLGLKVKISKHFGGLLKRVVGINPPAGTQVHQGDTVTLDIV